jgi:hypothetical protein
MDEQQVRQLVRQAIARHLGGAPGAAVPAPSMAASTPVRQAAPPAMAPSVDAAVHASLVRFHLVRPAGETECLIEPSVTCNHCGHCQCYGH